MGSPNISNPQPLRHVRTLVGHDRALRGLAWAPNGGNLLLSWASDQTLRVWDANSARAVRVIEKRLYIADSAALAPDQQLLAASSMGEGVDLWDSLSRQHVRSVPQGGNKTRTIAWAPKGRRLAWGSASSVWLWDIESEKPVQLYPRDAHGAVYDLAWSPDSRWFVTACERKTVQLWSADSQLMFRPFQAGHTQEVLCVAWSPDGQWFCSGSHDKVICIWEPETESPKRRLTTNPTSVLGLSVSFDGSLLAAQFYTFVRFWRTDTWKCLGDLPVPHGSTPALAFHPTLPLLATRGEENTILIWELDLSALFASAPFKRPTLRTSPLSQTPYVGNTPPAEATAPATSDPAADAQREQARAVLERKMAAKAFDVFISYSPTEERWVSTWLLPQLEQRGIYCYTIRRNTKFGTPKPKATEYAVRHCRKILLVLTPGWVANEWADFAGLLAQTLDPSGKTGRLIPLKYRKCQLPLRLDFLTPADFTKPASRMAELERLVAHINEP